MRAKIIKGVTYFMAVLLILSVMAIDSNSIIPFITASISLVWICLIAIANTSHER